MPWKQNIDSDEVRLKQRSPYRSGVVIPVLAGKIIGMWWIQKLADSENKVVSSVGCSVGNPDFVYWLYGDMELSSITKPIIK